MDFIEQDLKARGAKLVMPETEIDGGSWFATATPN